MDDFGHAFALAFELIARLDADLLEIVALSLQVSVTAVGLAALFGLPLGAAVALFRFPGRVALAALLNGSAWRRSSACRWAPRWRCSAFPAGSLSRHC
jgi:ABC-type tungstate transport system substrate-binding protein